MQVVIEIDGNQKYSGDYKFADIAAVMGVTPETRENAAAEIAVTIEPREGQLNAAAKLINYASVALIAQGVKTDIDFPSFRKQLAEKAEGITAPWQFVFADSDSALFFISVIRHTDQLPNPNWPVWFPTNEVENIEDGHSDDEFKGH